MDNNSSNNILELTEIIENKLNSIRCGRLSQYDTKNILYPRVLEDGITFSDYTVIQFGKKIDAPSCQCHSTSAKIFRNSDGIAPLRICNGWAYDAELQLWIYHSWVIHPDDKILLEPTPHSRDAYYGIVLTPSETAEFMQKWL